MQVVVPDELTYSTMSSMLARYGVPSFGGQDLRWVFDWSETRWAELPELVAMLGWSSRIASRTGATVEWRFRAPRRPPEGLDDARYRARLALGEIPFDRTEGELNGLVKDCSQGRLYAGQVYKALDRLKAIIGSARVSDATAARAWFDLAAAPLRYMVFLGYLRRYSLFSRAEEAGIAISPRPQHLLGARYGRDDETPALELRPVTSTSHVEPLVEELADPGVLARVLGQYAKLDVVSRGALAQILVRELGKNVGDHAEASAAWVCTRLVKTGQVHDRSRDDPTLESFRRLRQGFLEVIVCDNGVGLTAGLEAVLTRDPRRSVHEKYHEGEGTTGSRFTELALIDYAFDRLSSTKRDIVQLVLMDQETNAVPSGLYWVWSVVRNYGGVLAIRTGDSCAWYDFCGAHSRQDWTTEQIRTPGKAMGLFCGTMIRVCLPLRTPSDGAEAHASSGRSTGDAAPAPVRPSANPIRFVWAGNIPRDNRPLRSGGVNGSGDKVVSGRRADEATPVESSLVQALIGEHSDLPEGGILVLDMCGSRLQWTKDRASLLCRALLEMNYTSTCGRFAVVLWNVPKVARDVVMQAMDAANARYSQLRDQRRVALLAWDDGNMSVFCAWPEAERVLERLCREGELDLDNLGVSAWNREEQGRFHRLVKQSSHVLEFVRSDSVRLRAWPEEIREEAWRQGTCWLAGLLDRDLGQGGARLQLDSGHYRLPSTGLLVRTFYCFSGLLANHEARARIGWMLARVIEGLGKHKKVDWVVSVTRPVIDLARHIVENELRRGRGQAPGLLAENSVDLLVSEAQGRQLRGTAVLLTDVVSSGTLCERIVTSLPQMDWLGAVAILDTGCDIRQEDVTQENLGYRLEVQRTRQLGELGVHVLAWKPVERIEPAEATGPTVAIDRVNVCPVVVPARPENAGEPVWPHIRRRAKALRVGHFCTGDLHHYIYHVDVKELLESQADDGRSLADRILQMVNTDLRSGYDPDKTVVIHPPRATSYGEELGKAIERSTGALYRYVLHRESFAGQRRFSTFLQHGIPLKDSTVILVDDGCNTAETLLALLDAAAYGRPKRILAYVVLTRMGIHKTDVLCALEKLRGVANETRIRFATSLGIPAFSPGECPICRRLLALSKVRQRCILLGRCAENMASLAQPIAPTCCGAGSEERFLWRYSSETGTARLREAIELADYDERSNSYLVEVLSRITRDGSAASDMLDLAFAACTEPGLLSASVFGPFLAGLADAAAVALRTCPEECVLSFFGMATNAIAQAKRRAIPVDLPHAVADLWDAIMSRTSLSSVSLGQALTVLLSDAWGERGVEEGAHTQVARECITHLAQLVRTRRSKGQQQVIDAYAGFAAREALSALGGASLVSAVVPGDHETTSLYDLATAAASTWYWHAKTFVENNIDGALMAIEGTDGAAPDRLYGHVHSLILAFDSLTGLRNSLCLLEREYRNALGESIGASVCWDSPELGAALSRFGNELAILVEQTSPPVVETSERHACLTNLGRCYDGLSTLLQPAFDSVFPDVRTAVDAEWRKCQSVSDLPSDAVGGIVVDQLPGNARVFMPTTLVSRFVQLALSNFRTAAFAGWTSDERNRYARVAAEIRLSQEESGQPIVSILITDNGASRTVESPKGHTHTDINHVSAMAQPFGGTLVGPTTESGATTVELRMRLRESGGTACAKPR